MNQSIFYFFYNFAHQSDLFDSVIVAVAVYFPVVVVFLAGLFLLFHYEVFRVASPFRVLLQKRKEMLAVFFSTAVAYLCSTLFKIIFHVPRPFSEFADVVPLFPETGFAFPSTHATFFTALAFSLFFDHKKAGYAFMFFAFLIGIARVMAGVHFPVDILAGFALGALVAYLVKNV